MQTFLKPVLIAVLSTSTEVALVAVIIVLVITNIAIPITLVLVCKMCSRPEQKATADPPVTPCAAYGLVAIEKSTTEAQAEDPSHTNQEPEYETVTGPPPV